MKSHAEYDETPREYTKDEIIALLLEQVHNMCDIYDDNRVIAHAILGFLDGNALELPAFAVESKEVEGDIGGYLALRSARPEDELKDQAKQNLITPQCLDFLLKVKKMMKECKKEDLVTGILEELDEKFIVYPISTEEDKQYYIEKGANWFPLESERVNISGDLSSTYKKIYGKMTL